MTTRSSSLLTKMVLFLIVFALLTANLVPAWQNYQVRLSLRSDDPAGSTLAERYVGSGGWPASKIENSAIVQNQNFSVITPESSSKEHDRAR